MEKPEIIMIKEMNLVGMKIRTSLSDNKASELWGTFKSRVHEIAHKKNNDFYSIQIFEEDLGFNQLTPQTFFEKWAAIEVTSIEDVPEGFEVFTLPAGKYARFIHKGPANTFSETLRYIFGTWIPNSSYDLDARPHFEIMDENYKPDSNDSEEEVYIPIQTKLT